MTDAQIILLIAAGLFALWLLRRFVLARRKIAAGVAGVQPTTQGEPADDRDPDFEMLAVATFSPAYHNGVVFDPAVPPGRWPVVAIEDFSSFDEFDPARGELTEFVSATYAGPDDKTIELTEIVPDAADVVFTEIVGEDRKTRINVAGPAFNAGADFSTWPDRPYRAKFAVQRSVADRARKDLPDGFDPMPVCMTVKIHLALFGRSR